MSVKQISVFLENKPGYLFSMTEELGRRGIDMRAFSLAETSDFGIARLIVDDTVNTLNALKEAGFICSLSSVLAVAVPDVPGGLNRVLSLLADAGINVEYMYAFLGGKAGGPAYMIFRVADETRAAACLRAAGITLVRQEELAAL